VLTRGVTPGKTRADSVQSRAVSDATASGGRLGRYHLVEPIGGGANGEVFRAKVYGVAGFERQFAVKKFFPHVALNSRFAQQLSAAARAYGSLEHPRIARLAEFGVSGGHTFTATELVPGLDAARLLAETLGSGGSIPAGSALSLVSQAARAVGYAHGRGISHLGVAPTNLIISPEGEVRITDIGVLGACLPERPAHDGRFVTRIHYLAPEQLTGEPCSAATDVFALGLVAYELITGERAFVGATAEDVAQAILTGQPREPQLPRPIMRVLQRCLARSPFERFPDARALADALDAALRVSPVPGTRGDVAELAQMALARIAALHDQQLSGALQLNLPSAGRPDTVADRALAGDPETAPFMRESIGPERTLPDNNVPATTMQGMAPPPIPVPQGISVPPRTGPAFPGPHPTLQGVPPPRVPPVRPPTGGLPPPIPRAATARSDVTDATPAPAIQPPPPPPAAMRPPTGRFPSQEPTTDAGRYAPVPDAVPIVAIPETLPRPEYTEPVHPAIASLPSVLDGRLDTGEPVPPPPPSGRFPRHDSTGEPVPPPPPPGAIPSLTDGASMMHPGPPQAYESVHMRSAKTPRGKRGLTITLVALAVVALGAGGFFAYQYYTEEEEPAQTTKPIAGATIDAATPPAMDATAIATTEIDAVAVATTDDAAVEPADDAAGVATTDLDAAAVAMTDVDAAIDTPPADAAVAITPSADGSLVIDTKPSGARLFLGGADQGTTPVTLPGSTDRHSIALVLPGYAPYIAEIDGKGSYSIPLEEVTPSAGPAGIKVKCRAKDRYVVFLDGKPTGQLCPTERLEVEMGEHLVEIYDLVNESRRQFPCNVKETRLSLRIKVDY
jgi:serine/threonine protein kinase